MGKFYGDNTVFPGLPPASPATVPIIRQSLIPPPEALPVGGAIPSAPAGFAPYMIRPEVAGSIPQRGFIPPLWGEGTALSIRGKGIFSQPIDMTPAGVVGARPLNPPSPVIPFFTTRATTAAAVANTADLRASITAQRALELQRKADLLAHAANKAINKASVDPDPSTQGDARAKSDAAAKAQYEADLLAQQTAAHDRNAAEALAKAQAAADREAAAQAARDAANAQANAQGDEKAVLDTRGWMIDDQGFPLEIVPEQILQGPAPTSPGYLVPVGGGAVGGFLLGGPVGALIGALLGGGYTYAKKRSALSGAQYDPSNPLLY